MKATYFKSPFEYKLEVQGESWAQGEKIEGTLVAHNRGSDNATSSTRLFLGQGALKKVKAKSPGAFSDLKEIKVGSDGGWSIELDPNSPITDTVNSPYLLYGDSDQPSELGQLQLKVTPRSLFVEFSEVLERTWKFVFKFAKFKKTGVEFKLAAPSGKDLAKVDQVLILFSVEGEALNAAFTFSVQEIDASAGSMAVKKKKKKFELSLPNADYVLFNGHLDKEKVEKEMLPIIDQL